MRVVLVGTGTGIGKTHVACALLEAWAERGTEGVGLKPIETGVPLEGGLAIEGERALGTAEPPSDQCRLWESSRLFHVKQGRASTFHVKRSLYAFPEPVSPHLAARGSGVAIDFEAIQAWLAEHQAPAVIIETAGGLFSPLTPNATNFDLVSLLIPATVLLVAPDRLGVLHDVAATAGLAAARGLSIRGVVLSAPEREDLSTHRNAAELDRLGIARPIAAFPRQSLGHPSTRNAAYSVLDWLARAAE